MIPTKNKIIIEPSLLKNSENYPHFFYPVQPQSLSSINPLKDSIQNSEISAKPKESKITFLRQILDDKVSEQTQNQNLALSLKDFPFLQEDYFSQKQKCKFLAAITAILSNQMIVITSNSVILSILVYLPIQIGLISDHNILEILYSIIAFMKFIQFFHDQFKEVKMKELIKDYIKSQLPLHIVIILTFLMISQKDVPILQWLAYFFIFMYFRPTFDTVLYKIQKYIVCGLPGKQINFQQFCIAGKVILIVHILNCYLFQSLNQVGSSYLETLTNITIKVITLNNNTEYQNENVSIAVFLSYLFIILVITRANQQCSQLSRDLQIYFQHNNIPIKLKLKIYEELMNNSHQSTHIHEQLSQELQEQIAYNQRIAFIQDNFSSYDEATKFKLTQLCTTQYYKSGQCIMKQKQKDDNALYYLMQGKASIQLPKQVKITLKHKSTFGQLSFFTQCLRTATILCDSNCIIYKLQRQQFLDCLTHHDKQLFQLTKDQIEFHQSLPIQCLCCQQTTHVLANSKNINLSQPRAFYQRKGCKSTKAIYALDSQPKQKYSAYSQSNFSSQNHFLNQDDISLLKQLDHFQQGSYKNSSESVLSDKYGTIKRQLSSLNKNCSEVFHKAIPSVIHEISNDSKSMSIKSLRDFKRPQAINRQVISQKQLEKKLVSPSFQEIKHMSSISQNHSFSDSSLLSPIFDKDILHPSNQLSQKQGDSLVILRKYEYDFKIDDNSKNIFNQCYYYFLRTSKIHNIHNLYKFQFQILVVYFWRNYFYSQMIFSENLKGHSNPRSLMKNSPEFPYPVEPDCKSVMEPQFKSREEMQQNLAFSILQIHSPRLEQNSFLDNSVTFTPTFKHLALFNEIGTQEPQISVLTYLEEQIVQSLIIMSLIFLPVQIAFISSQYVLLHLIIPAIRITFHLNRRGLSNFFKHIGKLGIQTIIIVICLLIIVSQLNYLYFWLGYIIYFISYTAMVKNTYSRIRRLLICLAPQYSQLLLIIPFFFLTHLLNCFVYHSLLVNHQESSYFDCLQITLCLIANISIPNIHITKSMQLVTIAAYFYIIYLLLKIHQVKRDIPLYFLDRQEISISMRFKIFDELSTNKSHKIKRQLSPNLVNLIHQDQCSLFIKQNFESYDSFQQIAQNCEVVEFKEGQKIVELNRKDDCSLYFILKGEIKVMLNKQQFKLLSEKCTIGQLSFYTQQGRTATVICASNCSVLKLSRQRLLNLLKSKDLERFHLIKDQIIFSEQLPFQIQCYNCEESNHVILNCPHIKYSLQNEKLIELYNQSNIQNRSECKRKPLKNQRIVISNYHSGQFKLKLKKVLNVTSMSSELYANSDHVNICKDGGGSRSSCYSPILIGDQLFTDQQQGILQGMLLRSDDRVFSLQDIQLHPKIILEDSIESNQSSVQRESPSLPTPESTKKKQNAIKQKHLQKDLINESSLNLSPIFKGEQSNPSSNLIQIQSKRSIPKRSKYRSYSGKVESGLRSGLSSFQAFSQNENEVISKNFVQNDFDQMHIFELYYPRNNYDKILVDQEL